jgi:triosephosphate isomerase
MRRALIAGNWKMNLLRAEAALLVAEILAAAEEIAAKADLLLFPPYPLLSALAEQIGGAPVAIGAQDLHWEPGGAYTSGVSAAMIRDAGCSWVLVGHSERRDHFGDGGEILARKLRAALAGGLLPVYCVGEHLEEREAGKTETVLAEQFRDVLGGLEPDAFARVTLAYEPVWAIGTGRTATPQMAQEAHLFLRRLAEECFGAGRGRDLRILYGGSVKPENASQLLGQPDVDGALIGGASLKAESFLAIARA